MSNKLKATEEQLAYAKLLDYGMKAGLLILVLTFIIYVLGLLPSHIPMDDISKYWSMSVHDYLKVTNIHTGWSWLYMLHRGDFLNFIGIAFLAGITVICYIRIIPIFLKKKDLVYAILAVLESLVLILAASGLLKTGGH